MLCDLELEHNSHNVIEMKMSQVLHPPNHWGDCNPLQDRTSRVLDRHRQRYYGAFYMPSHLHR